MVWRQQNVPVADYKLRTMQPDLGICDVNYRILTHNIHIIIDIVKTVVSGKLTIPMQPQS